MPINWEYSPIANGQDLWDNIYPKSITLKISKGNSPRIKWDKFQYPFLQEMRAFKIWKENNTTYIKFSPHIEPPITKAFNYDRANNRHYMTLSKRDTPPNATLMGLKYVCLNNNNEEVVYEIEWS